MNTIKTNDVTKVRELSDAELAGVAGGLSNVAKIWMNVMGATPTQGTARETGSSLTPAQQAKYA